jgi:hypothetical protein
MPRSKTAWFDIKGDTVKPGKRAFGIYREEKELWGTTAKSNRKPGKSGEFFLRNISTL